MTKWIAAFLAFMLVAVCPITGSAAQTTTLRVYYMLETPSAFRLFPVDVQVPATVGVARAAIQSLLAGPPVGVVKSPFPEGVRLLDVGIKDGVAAVDLSSKVMYPGLGSEAEAVLVYSIVNTLSAFPSVQKVRLLVEGREVETIGGHMYIGEPLTKDYSLLFEGFSDVWGHWSEGAVLALSMSGIISGYPDGTFKPDDEIKRSEFVKLLVQTLGITGEATLSFSDVPESHWARGSIAAAQSAGIVRPTDGARFRPDEAATRAEMAVWLARALSVDTVGDEPGTASPFTDVAGLDDATRRCINTVAAKGLIRGYGGGIFGPERRLTRAEAATVFTRLARMGENHIYVVPPVWQPGQSSLLLVGTARVFEGTVLFRILDQDRNLLKTSYTTATSPVHADGYPWGLFGMALVIPEGAAYVEVGFDDAESGRFVKEFEFLLK